MKHKFTGIFLASLVFSAAAHASDLIIGIGTHLGQQKATASNVKFLSSIAGINSFRDEVYWHRVERTAGIIKLESDLAEIDGLITNTGNTHNLLPLLILGYGNKFYYGSRQPETELERNAFVKYSKYVAERYSNKVYAFEIWNEWNIGAGNPKGSPRYGDPTHYFNLVKAVSPVVRASSPNSKIVCGAVAERDTAWLESTFRLGILNYCDAISVHPYVFSEGKKSDPHHAFVWVDSVNALIQKYANGSSKPVLITELGWPNQNIKPGIPSTHTAAFLAQSLLLTKARPWIEGIWWYELIDSGTDPSEREHNFGIVKNSLTPKPAFNVFKALSGIISKSETLGSGTFSDGRNWVRLRLPEGDEATAVWTAGGTSRNFKMRNVGLGKDMKILLGSAPPLNTLILNAVVGELPLVIRHPKDALILE